MRKREEWVGEPDYFANCHPLLLMIEAQAVPGTLANRIHSLRQGLRQSDCKRHRTPSVVAAKIDVFAKNGYNKCNKFRKIMKIITWIDPNSANKFT